MIIQRYIPSDDYDGMIYTLLLIPEGATPGNSWWGCAARVSKS